MFREKQMKLNIMVLKAVSRPQKNKCHIFSHMKNLDLHVYKYTYVACEKGRPLLKRKKQSKGKGEWERGMEYI